MPNGDVDTFHRDGSWRNKIAGHSTIEGRYGRESEAAGAGRKVARSLKVEHIMIMLMPAKLQPSLSVAPTLPASLSSAGSLPGVPVCEPWWDASLTALREQRRRAKELRSSLTGLSAIMRGVPGKMGS